MQYKCINILKKLIHSNKYSQFVKVRDSPSSALDVTGEWQKLGLTCVLS